MKKVLLLFIAAGIIAGGFIFFKHQLRNNLAFNSKCAGIFEKIDEAHAGVGAALNRAGKVMRRTRTKLSKGPEESADEASKTVRITLRHGGVIEGALISKTKDAYVVEWKGGEVRVSPEQIKDIEYITAREAEWPYKNNAVVRRTNGIVLDGKVVDANPDEITLSFDEGGGTLEMTVRRLDIDCILFAPVLNKESREIERHLKTQFPKMKIYREGNITVFTDSYGTWVKLYAKTLRAQNTDIYLKFFKVFEGRSPRNQNFVVIFDDFIDYVEYALTDGVPGWLAVGYFEPVNKTLFIFNAFGSKMEKMVFDVIVGKTGRSIDDIVKQVKKRVDERYHIFIDGQVKELTDRYWDVYSLYRAELTALTLSVLRHEFTHEMFNSWGLQNIIISKPNIDRKKLAARKKEILDTKDWKKKEELLMSLMKMRKPEDDIEIESAQSWLNEGLATYCETEPIGAIDRERLFAFQEMAREDQVNPIEFLTSFEIGSFRGLTHRAKLDAYAESWAFTTFLINKYPSAFADYQIALVQTPGSEKDELNILLKTLNKELPVLEKEFREYMGSYEKIDDPDVARFMKYYDIWSDLLQSSR